MLTTDEEDFLSKQTDKIITVKPFNPSCITVATKIINRIKAVFPNADVRHLGASSLGLSGQNDIDMYILSDPSDFDKYLSGLIKLFGETKWRKYDSNAWKFIEDGIEVELYLTDPTSKPMQRQIGVYNALKASKKLQKEYEKLKEKFNGKSWIEMQKAKYTFYHKVLDN